jgi:hypothetical protein
MGCLTNSFSDSEGPRGLYVDAPKWHLPLWRICISMWSIFLILWFIGFYCESFSSGHVYVLIVCLIMFIYLSLRFTILYFFRQEQYTYLRPVLSSTRENLPAELKQLFLKKLIDSIDYILFYYWYVVCWDKISKPTIWLKERKQYLPINNDDWPNGVVRLCDINLRITKNSDIKPCNMRNYSEYVNGLLGYDVEGKKNLLYKVLSPITKFKIIITCLIYIAFFIAAIITNIYCNWMYKGLLFGILQLTPSKPLGDF